MTAALRPARPEECELAFEFKRDAMGPHIRAKWGWDEDFQREHHRRRWDDKPWQVILLNDQPVGTVSLDWQSTHLQFGEFYIGAGHRGRGLGTTVVQSALRQADQRAIEARLEYLRWNPVASLYLRHGFRVIAESEIHFFAVRAPSAA